MKRRLARLVGALFVAFVVLGGGVVIPDVVEKPSCNFAKSWATAHASGLPRTVDELSAIPREFRRGVFAALSPSTRSAIVRELFRRVLQEGNLSSEQIAALETADARLTPELYESVERAHEQQDRESAAWLLALDTEHELQRAFPGREASRIAFAALPHTWSLRSAVAQLQMYAWLHRTVFADPMPCQCFKWTSECRRLGDCTSWQWGPNTICKDLGPGCAPQGSGCGLSGVLPCDGLCSVMDCPQIE